MIPILSIIFWWKAQCEGQVCMFYPQSYEYVKERFLSDCRALQKLQITRNIFH